jgi:hypothetical protein
VAYGYSLVDLPELKMETTSEDDDEVDGNFWKQTQYVRFIPACPYPSSSLLGGASLFLGFWAEFLYVGVRTDPLWNIHCEAVC